MTPSLRSVSGGSALAQGGLTVWGLRQRRHVMEDRTGGLIGVPGVAAGLAAVVVHAREFAALVQQPRRCLAARGAGLNKHEPRRIKRGQLHCCSKRDTVPMGGGIPLCGKPGRRPIARRDCCPYGSGFSNQSGSRQARGPQGGLQSQARSPGGPLRGPVSVFAF